MSFYEEAPDIADVIADASNWEPSDSTSEIEEMVLSFLRQLANGGRANHQGVSDESDDQPVKPAKPKIQIQLTDRTKDYVDGYNLALMFVLAFHLRLGRFSANRK